MSHARAIVSLIALIPFWLLGACQSTSEAPALGAGAPPALAPEGVGSGVYVLNAPTPAKRWAVLLPGASGLKIFDDAGHYFRAAATLNERGFHVLVIDYRHAYRASRPHPDRPTGEKIAWVVEQALELARRNGAIEADAPGTIIAWSLGAEGLWVLAPDRERLGALGVTALAAYYPANDEEKPIQSVVPLLIQTGEADDVTAAGDIRDAVKRGASAGGDPVLHVYPDVHHGFDVESIVPERTVSLVPIIGPRATFAFHAEAAAAARMRLLEFLDAHVAR